MLVGGGPGCRFVSFVKKNQAHFRCRLNLQDSSWQDCHGMSECHVCVFFYGYT